MEIKIVVAVHKPYWVPDEPLYLPVQVGAFGKQSIGFRRDDEGQNISGKNANYCELTGLYWAWKNLDANYLGLVHYRRYFGKGWIGDKKRRILHMTDIKDILTKTEVILPKQRHYWIETNYSQYIHAHHSEDLAFTRDIIHERCPDYLAAFDYVMSKRRGHRFNMFVMKKEIMEEYCNWLFDILFELEKRLDISTYNRNDQRVFGFVGERLLDVWIKTNHVSYKDQNYIFLERQDWIAKSIEFLRRKLRSGNMTGKKRNRHP